MSGIQSNVTEKVVKPLPPDWRTRMKTTFNSLKTDGGEKEKSLTYMEQTRAKLEQPGFESRKTKAKELKDACDEKKVRAEKELEDIRSGIVMKQGVVDKKLLELQLEPNDLKDLDLGKITERLNKARKDQSSAEKALDDLPDPDASSLFGDEDDPPQEDVGPEVLEQRAKLTQQIETLKLEQAKLKSQKDVVELSEAVKQLKLDEVISEEKSTEAGKAFREASANFQLALRAASANRRLCGESDVPKGDGAKQGASGYDAESGEWTGDRPDKPDGLKGVDEDGDSLTAHHIRPWNQIRDEINDALADQSGGKLNKLLKDYKVSKTPPGGFFEELQLDPPARSSTFANFVKLAGTEICWAPQNVFMGPVTNKRGDDPGEKVDTAFTRSGLPTARSAMVELSDPDNREIKRICTAAADGFLKEQKPERLAGLKGNKDELAKVVTSLLDGLGVSKLATDFKIKEEQLKKRLEAELRGALRVGLAGAASTDELGDAGYLLARPFAEDAVKTFQSEQSEAFASLKSDKAQLGKVLDDLMKRLASGIEKLAEKLPKPQDDRSEAEPFADQVRAALRLALQDALAGGGGGLREQLTENVIDAEEGITEARPYSPQEWKTIETGKMQGRKARRGKVVSPMREAAEALLDEATQLTGTLRVMLEAPPREQALTGTFQRADELVLALRAVKPSGKGETIDKVLEQRDFDDLQSQLGETATALEAAVNTLKLAI